MSGKKSTQVIIDGRILNLAGYESEEYLQNIAAYVNRKIREIDAGMRGRFINPDLRAALIEINIADDLLKLDANYDLLDEDLKKCTEELKLLKQELASLQVRYDRLEAKTKRSAKTDEKA